MKKTGAFLAATATCVACAASAWQILADRAAPSFDEAWYLEVSFRLFNSLADGRPLAFISDFAHAFRFKAPLVSALPLPLYAVIGPSYHAAALANLPALAVLALSLYGLGRRFFSEAAGGMSAALALLMPMTAHLSRLFFVECWLTALTALFLWRWVETEALEKKGSAVPLGALAGLGFLTKVLFPLSALPPAALSLYERRPLWRELEPNLKAFTAAAAAVALIWYGPNLVYVVGYSFQASFGGIAAHYASGSPFSPPILLRFWSALARDGFSWPVTVFLLGSLLLLGRRKFSLEPGLRFALAWLLPAVLAASAGRSKELRFAAPALPAAALMLAGTLDLLTRSRKFRTLVFVLALALPADLFCRQTFGASLLPTTPLTPSTTVYGGPPRPAPRWDAQALARELSTRIDGPAVVVVGAEHGELNANLLSAWAELGGSPLTFVHYGHMEGRVERTVSRLSEKDATHILFIQGIPADEAPATVPAVDKALLHLIATGRLPFEQVASFPIPPNLQATLYKRTGPIRMVSDIQFVPDIQ